MDRRRFLKKSLQVSFVFQNGVAHRHGLGRERGFPETRNSLVRKDLYEHVIFVAASIHDECLNIRNAQSELTGGYMLRGQ